MSLCMLVIEQDVLQKAVLNHSHNCILCAACVLGLHLQASLRNCSHVMQCCNALLKGQTQVNWHVGKVLKQQTKDEKISGPMAAQAVLSCHKAIMQQ